MLRRAQAGYHGGREFADEQTDTFTLFTSFGFEYLPTILGVLHSLMWAPIAHDCMRLEPYFQMSKGEGASAENSVLLDCKYF